MEVLTNVFSLNVLFVCLLGTVAGVILGAIPGMNGGIGIAVMLPFTYSMSPAPGLLFLGGMYLGSSYGGSISGILINVPGTAESACTAMEGYPMTCRGEGKKALYYSIIASSFGSLVGLVILILFAPILSAVSVKFGPPEMMLLALCGLSIVGSLTGKNVAKGLVAALIGLFLAMIGVDEATGVFRFTFGTRALLGGIDLIPAVIGLFAITEMVKQGMGQMQEGAGSERLKLIPANLSEILKNTFGKYLGILLRSSLMGTFIGILPGTGGAIASFLAYGDAKSGDKEGTFGTGNPAGIIAPESANNAAVGGSLVPMLSLGIPGSATSAIMFGALTIQGLVPGQRLFVDHADIVYTFMVGMFVVAFFMFVIGILGIPLFAHILKLKMKHIIPVVILFSLIGAYSVNNSVNDVLVAISLGVLGVFLARLEIPNTPIVLGLILGDIIESNFIRSSIIVKAQQTNFFTYILTRPLCIGILLLTTYLIWANLRVLNRGKRIQKAANIQQDIQEE
jgi:putative tricarboxylic transport membrane protein